jgi:phosphohistidine swiveling domain-containing protein
MHMDSGPAVMWTTRNFGEAIPGVQTPLGLTFWVETSDVTLVRTTADIGVVAARKASPSGVADERFMGMFYGRMAGNISRFRDLADRMPGSSGDSFEEQIFGTVRSGERNRPRRARYPITAVKMPYAAWRSARAQRQDRVELDRWWTSVVAEPPSGLDAARALFDEACRRFQPVIGAHGLITMLAQGCYEQVRGLAARAGMAGAEAELITGYGGLEETVLLSDLWRVAREGASLTEFVGRHGSHGSSSGDLSRPSWREDRGQLESLLEAYQALPESERPEQRQHRQLESRRATERRLLAGLPRWRRPLARAVLKGAAFFVPLRETGKTAYIQAIDVARLAARVAGRELAGAGVIEAADDVFFFTRAELAGVLPDNAGVVVEARKRFYRECQRVRLPDYWKGVPEPLPLERPVERSGAPVDLHGIGVSPGVVVGTVRVVHDSDEDQLQPGEILVCETTNPSWVTLFLVADAMVIDIGGVISHGAIAARELGIPCVINTRDGTRLLRTGDTVRVDGSTGVVAVLDRAASMTDPVLEPVLDTVIDPVDGAERREVIS